MSSENVDLVDALEGLQDIINDEAGDPSQAIEEAKEPGLNPNQLSVVEKYEGGDFIEVEDSTTPNLMEKLAVGAELPWTFVLDSVQFVVKTGVGEGGDPSRWSWWEEGYYCTYLKYDDPDKPNQISFTPESEL